jgi:arabinofuranosyltransferase
MEKIENSIENSIEIKNNLLNKVIIFFALLIIFRVYYYGWVTDDAFITFRSVLNFINGDGLVFNIGERVQSYTHPLWFLILSFFGFFDTNLYFLSIVMGTVFTGLFLFFMYKLYIEKLNYKMGFIVILILYFNSDIFLQFSTSGLENSLTNLLIILIYYFFFSFYNDLDKNHYKIFIVSFLISLLLLNRLDQLFMLLPLMCYLFLKDFKYFIFGLFPIISWHIFSLIYYGFLFPNTKYAKIGGKSLLENLHSGTNYLIDSIQSDILFFFFLFIILTLSLFIVVKNFRKEIEYKNIIILISLGIIFQLVYIIILAGGDFMRGRFFISILVLSTILFGFLRIKLNYLIIGTIFIFSFISYNIGFKENFIFKTLGLTNERNYYKNYLALNLQPYNNYSFHSWGVSGQELNKNNQKVIIGVNGQRGYWIKEKKLIDLVGLTDAFIARTPIEDSTRVGHFKHKIPNEYFHILDGNIVNNWEDKELEDLYLNINIVIKEEIFSIKRLNAMLYLWKHYGI